MLQTYRPAQGQLGYHSFYCYPGKPELALHLPKSNADELEIHISTMLPYFSSCIAGMLQQ